MEGSLCACFLAIKQECTIAEFSRLFKELPAPLLDLVENGLVSTFLDDQNLVIRAEVMCMEPVELEKIMKTTQLIEDRQNTIQAQNEVAKGPRTTQSVFKT